MRFDPWTALLTGVLAPLTLYSVRRIYATAGRIWRYALNGLLRVVARRLMHSLGARFSLRPPEVGSEDQSRFARF